MKSLSSSRNARTQDQKKIQERKRAMIILIQKYLLGIGYLDIATRLEQESKLQLDSYDNADNLDLYIILAQYENNFQRRFGRAPRLYRKLQKSEDQDPRRTKKREGSTELPIPMKPKSKKQEKKEEKKQEEHSLQIAGNAVGKKNQAEQDWHDVRVTKGMPDYSNVPELRDLANSLQRDICIENPNVKFEDIVGLDDAKRLLKQAVMLPLKYPYLFKGILQPWRGVLLFGPPGTGKTMLAKAVATQCRTTFFNISASSIVSKWRGQSQKLIRVLFDLARHYQPSTIFLDELDSIMSQRSDSGAEHEGSRRMKTELLIQLDGLIKNKQRVFLLAASNLPWDLDAAMLRRLQKRILVPLPEKAARLLMLQKFLQNMGSLDHQKMSERTQGYSGSDLRLLCKQAAMKPLRRLLIEIEDNKKRTDKVEMGPIMESDLEQAFAQTKPSPGLGSKRYQQWMKNFGSM